MSYLRDRQPFRQRITREQSDHRSHRRNSSTLDRPEAATNDNYNLVNQTPWVGNGELSSPMLDSYRDGYAQGQLRERRFQNERLRARQDESTAHGLFLGILLTSLIGAMVIMFYWLGERRNAVPVAPVPVPTATQSPQAQAPQVQPSTSQTTNTQVRERVIERTREYVPVLQAPASEPSSQQQPTQQQRTQQQSLSSPAPSTSPSPVGSNGQAPTSSTSPASPAPEGFNPNLAAQ
jgi:hypothetical protein